MNRLVKKMESLKNAEQTALITYITAGDPNIELTKEIIYTLEKSGADVIEIGIPHSDPVADGPIIQAAGQRALKNNIKVSDIFECVRKARINTQIPICFLVYFNMIYVYGIEAFVQKCYEVGVDGLVIPDLPLEERDEILPYLKKHNISLIPLVAPTSLNRVKDIVKDGSGFIYCISSLGITGHKDGFYNQLDILFHSIKSETKIPLAVGFGISSSSDIEKFRNKTDGIIIGSALVELINKSNGDMKIVSDYVKKLKKVVKN